jgi:hypothetical protein
MSTIGKSKTLDFTVTVTNAVDVVVIFGLREGTTILEKWAYPARNEYETLTANGFAFSGVLSEDATKTAKNGNLVMDVKAWDSNDKTAVARYNVGYIADTYVKDIDKLETS